MLFIDLILVDLFGVKEELKKKSSGTYYIGILDLILDIPRRFQNIQAYRQTESILLGLGSKSSLGVPILLSAVDPH